MLRLADQGSDELLPRSGKPAGDAGDADVLPFDAIAHAEGALSHAEKRMENLMDLVRRFGLDAPGDGPRVA
ncbi:MAG: hypothetical protein ACF8R7_07120 [Phycisphaerales bacterium JB039]